MLTEFSVFDRGPFKDRVVVSMRAGSSDSHPENVLESRADDGGLLGSVLFLGPNSSGKSMLLESLDLLRSIASGDPVPSHREAFVFGEGATEISISFTSRLIPYDYSISYTTEGVVSESLYQYATGRRSMVFLRSGDGFRFGKGAVKNRKTISVDGRRSFLSAAAESGDEACSDALKEILRMRTALSGLQESLEILESDPELKGVVLRALRLADFRVTGIRLTESGLEFEHSTEDERFSLPLSAESDGLKRALQVLTAVCSSLMEGSVAVVDDLDLHLHPRVVRWILEQYTSDRDPNLAQLVASVHDATLLDSKGLVRRDQVYFLDKGVRDGASKIARLTEFGGVRKDADLQKAYFGWRFDALPRISSSEELLRRRRRKSEMMTGRGFLPIVISRLCRPWEA